MKSQIQETQSELESRIQQERTSNDEIIKNYKIAQNSLKRSNEELETRLKSTIEENSQHKQKVIFF